MCPFIKGAFREEPPLLSKYDVMWKQQKVLEYLDNHEPIELLIIKVNESQYKQCEVTPPLPTEKNVEKM